MPDIAKVVSQVMKERMLIGTMRSGSGCRLPDDSIITDRPIVNTIVNNGAARISAGPGITRQEGFDRAMASMIDHTLLKPEATVDDVKTLCEEARRYSFASVCVNPSYVPLCVEELAGSKVKVCAVIGFPFGATTTAAKVSEVEDAVMNGATEFDMVIHIGKLKSGDYDYVERDIKAVVRTAKKHSYYYIVKVIIETCFLTDEEKVAACMIAKNAGADFVKTSTGFGVSGAAIGDVALMRRVVGTAVGVKASGGIRTTEEAIAMMESGADRIGASASVKIVN